MEQDDLWTVNGDFTSAKGHLARASSFYEQVSQVFPSPASNDSVQLIRGFASLREFVFNSPSWRKNRTFGLVKRIMSNRNNLYDNELLLSVKGE